jgi:hypothetical protein
MVAFGGLSTGSILDTFISVAFGISALACLVLAGIGAFASDVPPKSTGEFVQQDYQVRFDCTFSF